LFQKGTALKRRLLRIFLNLLAVGSGYLCLYISSFSRGNADRFFIGKREYFIWASNGRVQFGVPGEGWHSFDSRLAIFLTGVYPAYRIAAGYVRWNRKYNQRRLDRIAAQRGACPQCGYDLRATPHRCPECGALPSEAPVERSLSRE
jgi:hypothetical protein